MFEAESGLKIMEGATFEINAGLMIEAAETGYLDATGSDTSPVTFTAQQKTMNGSWKGILFRAQNELNKLIFTDVSYAGSDILPGMANKANIAVAPTGSLAVLNLKVHDSAGLLTVVLPIRMLIPMLRPEAWYSGIR
jgi:hypothetical protein